jgi:glycosyltransferase involved in cell wall biosynthesis
VTRVHQFHPVLAPGDAMSNHVFALQERLRGWGHEAHAYAVEAKPGAADVLPYRRLFRDVAPDDLVILHFSMGHEVFTQLAKLRARKVLVYHNITPADFFRGINAHAATHARLGRRQLAELAPAIDLAIGVSAYNQRELDAAGYARTAHVPILIDWRALEVAPDDATLARWDGIRPLLLFVGRVAPHKRQDDLIRMLAYYRACIDPGARLVLVGGHRDQPRYHARLVELVRALQLEPAVTFAGAVTAAELAAYYRSASAFVSLSEHEGFGVPLLEAMRFDLPVIAYDAAAVGETVGGAGVLLKDRDLAEAAEAVGLVLERRELHEGLVAAGRQRLEAFDPDRVAERTREVLGL